MKKHVRQYSRLILPTARLLDEYQVHEDMLAQLETSPRDLIEQTVVHIAQEEETQVYRDLTVVRFPHRRAMDEIGELIYVGLVFQNLDPDEQASAALVIEHLIMNAYLHLTHLIDCAGLTDFQRSQMAFHGWQGRDLMIEFPG